MERNHRKEYLARKARIAAGTVGTEPGRPRNTPERLWEQVNKRGPDECWEWQGYVGENGYGRVQIEGQSYYAHRVIFNLANPGVINISAPVLRTGTGFLMHSCDNRLCCNPAHLEPTTIAENNQDCQQKGRRNLRTGERHHRAVFSDREAQEILELAKQGFTTRQIAEKLNKNRDSIKSLLYRHRVEKIKRVTVPEEKIAKILQMRQDGHTQQSIATIMNMNLSTVKSICQRRGV
jgi:DNA-binding CsgD family transcriptional regulator